MISHIFYDFDGVMTDNMAYVDQNGNEMVRVNRSDGLAISEIRKLGITQLIFSTEDNKVVSARAKKLKIDCLQGIQNKEEALSNFCKINLINLKDVIFVGNDINDKEAMKISGLSICPSDAHSEIKKIASIELTSAGGNGVIREVFDKITKGEIHV
tara:strand:- start:491 stop:958 length:468 start_codon:yes stop_codon:yes gene_type:complete